MKSIVLRILKKIPFYFTLKNHLKKSSFYFLFFSKKEYKIFKKMGDKYKVKYNIHPDDFIYKFIKSFHENSGERIEKGIEYYFSSGAESAFKIHEIIKKENIEKEKSILEFASGYGCTTRHLYKYFNNITTCDIHEEANLFNKKIFSWPYFSSVVNPRDYILDNKFDVIFALSFFSHIPEKNFTSWLIALSKCLNDGGILIFTTHGDFTKKRFFPYVKINKNGFWFKASSEQKDLSQKTYGTSISTKEFVEREINKIGNLKILKYKEADWWGNQDSYVVKKNKPLKNTFS